MRELAAARVTTKAEEEVRRGATIGGDVNVGANRGRKDELRTTRGQSDGRDSNMNNNSEIDTERSVACTTHIVIDDRCHRGVGRCRYGDAACCSRLSRPC